MSSVIPAGGSVGVLTRMGWSCTVQDRMGGHRAVSTTNIASDAGI